MIPPLINWMTPRRIRLAGLLALTSLACLSLNGQTLAEVKADLSGPAQILLQNGNRQMGMITSWNGDLLRLKVKLGAGSAEMTFRADEIKDIGFSGENRLQTLQTWTEDPARATDALALFRAFYQQRGAFLQYMDASELNLFVNYALFALKQGKPLRAVAMIEVLRPYIQDDARLKSLDDAALLGLFLGGMNEQAESQAIKWIEAAEPAGESALGWRILAEMRLREERYEDALWRALYPIAFANQMPMEHLEFCYALAIRAAIGSDQEALAERLTDEMLNRGLAWPSENPLLGSGLPEELLAVPAAEAPVEVPAKNQNDKIEEIQKPGDSVDSLPTRTL